MGQVSTEQTVQIIESVANALNTKDTITKVIVEAPEPNMDFRYLLLLAIIPVILTWLLRKKK